MCDAGRRAARPRVRSSWLAGEQFGVVFAARASPQQNGYIERFNDSMEREVFSCELFDTVLEAQVLVDERLIKYDTRHAHRGLGV